MKKDKKKNSFKGVTSLVISQCIVKVLGLVYKLYLANKDGFGDAGNAIYNAGFQIYALLLTISSIGVPNVIAKLIAEKRYIGDKNQVGSILKTAILLFFVIGLIFSILLVLLAGTISKKIINMEETKYTIIALAPAIFNVCIISVFRGFYNGTNNIDITAKSQTIEQIYKTIFTVLLVEIFYYISGKCTVVLAVVANFATTLATFSSLLYLNKKCEYKILKYRFSIAIAKKVIKMSIPISISAILASLNRIIDSATVVRFLKNSIGEVNARIGYGILSGKVDVLVTVPISFIIAASTTIIPKISFYAARKEKKKISYTVELYMLFTIVLILPCIVGLFVFSDNIMNILFKCTEGSILLRISSLSILFISLEQIIHAVLHGLGKVSIPAISLACGVLLKIILNIFLLNNNGISYIAKGINGACIATLVCHIVAFSISFICLKRTLRFKINTKKIILRPIISITIMCIFAKIGKNICTNFTSGSAATAVIGISAVTVYFTAIYILRVFSKEELKMLPFVSKLINFAKK